MKTRGLRSNSRPTRFRDLDKRTAEGRLFDQFYRELVAHVGGQPNVVQAAMIERCAWVHLRIRLMDEKLALGDLTDQDSKSYLAWANTLRRLLQSLGLAPPATTHLGPTLADLRRAAASRGAVA
jgi:hypothetical protein